MKIEMTNKQTRTLSQQQQQSMKILQMSAHELDIFINELSLENPMFDILPPEERPEQPIHDMYFSNYYIKKDDQEVNREGLFPIRKKLTFKQTIIAQIMGIRVSNAMYQDLRYLVEEMDDRGFLPSDYENLPLFCHDEKRYTDAVQIIQSFEPAGVGARSLAECLCLQLNRKGVTDTLPYVICEKYLKQLCKGQLKYIADELSVPLDAVRNTRELVSSLNPNPANGYSASTDAPYILPDIEVISGENGLEVYIAEKYNPRYVINPYYLKMSLDAELSEEEQAYFKDKLAQAKCVIEHVSRRKSTLLACAEIIVARQRNFFVDRVSPMLPLTMSEIAIKMNVHPSTVSRTIKDKYLLCQWGVFPLSHFVVSEVASSGSSKEEIVSVLKQIVDREDSKHPLSDRELSEELAKLGYRVARRTVVKYRESLQIPSACARKVR